MTDVRVRYTPTVVYEPWRRLKLTFRPVAGNPERRWVITCDNRECGEIYAAINCMTILSGIVIAERIWCVNTVVSKAATHSVSVVYGPEVEA